MKLRGRHGAISKKTGHQRIQMLLSSVSVRSEVLSLVGVSPFPVWQIRIPNGIFRWRFRVRPLEPPRAPRAAVPPACPSARHRAAQHSPPGAGLVPQDGVG